MRVILNADDLGLSEAVNDAILRALQAGRVTSTSLLANGPAFDDAVRRIRGLDLCVGVHLNLTEFAPLTGAVSALLEDGHLSGRAVHAGAAQVPGVIREWSAQIERVLDAGIRPSHLDSHQHLHLRPALIPALRAVAERYEVRRIRAMGAWRVDVPPWRALPHRARAAVYNARLRRWAHTTDGFGSVTVLRRLLAAGGPPGRTFEAMAHPGNPHHARYAEELEWLASDEASRLVRVAWTDL